MPEPVTSRSPAQEGVHPWRVILLATLPFWCYLTINNALISAALEADPNIRLAPQSIRLWQHAWLLPTVVLFYRWAWRVGLPVRRRAAAILFHLCLGVVFAATARAWLLSGYVIMEGRPGAFTGWTWSELLLGYLPFGLRSILEWTFNYFAGLALVVGLRTWMELRAERERMVRLREDWLRARLDALSNQLNPHFLFNSINTIVALARRDNDRAEQLVAELADLLREAMRPDRPETISVAEEFAFVARYLGIEQARYQDRLQVEFVLSPECVDMRVPTHILQPLAENAIKHSVSAVSGPGSIRVEGRCQPGVLTLVVENTCSATLTARGGGIGLRNVRERLEMLYPGRHDFTAGATGDGRWRVELRLISEGGAV